MILDENTLRKIRRLRLVADLVRAGRFKGERRSRRRGASQEFADYRDYTPGDDLRRLDWNIYARLERPYIKLFEEEEDLAVYVLLDASRSMDWGEGPAHKFSYAVRLAAALGSIALSGGDAVWLLAPGAAALPGGHGPWRGAQNNLPFLQALETTRPGGITDLERWLGSLPAAYPRPGLVFLLSDLLSPTPFETRLAQLQGRGYETAVLHLLSPQELHPALAGDLRLVDVETGQSLEVSADSDLRQRYARRLDDWREALRNTCRQRGIHYLPVDTATPWERTLLDEMRRMRLIR